MRGRDEADDDDDEDDVCEEGAEYISADGPTTRLKIANFFSVSLGNIFVNVYRTCVSPGYKPSVNVSPCARRSASCVSGTFTARKFNRDDLTPKAESATTCDAGRTTRHDQKHRLRASSATICPVRPPGCGLPGDLSTSPTEGALGEHNHRVHHRFGHSGEVAPAEGRLFHSRPVIPATNLRKPFTTKKPSAETTSAATIVPVRPPHLRTLHGASRQHR